MWLADSNVWLSLAVVGHQFHSAADQWMKRRSRNEVVNFCRFTQQSFLRLITTKHVTLPYNLPPMSNVDAWQLYADWLRDDRFAFVAEPKGIEANWRRFSDRTTPSPKIWMDTYLAAFAVTGNYRFVTTDSAFRQFSGLNVVVLQT
jgi:uncharacterized protein